MHYTFISLFVLLGISWSYFSLGDSSSTIPMNEQYNFDKPSQIFELPKSLNEISGITFYDESTLACVQDEKGRIYFFDIHKKELVRELKFQKKGDYEDISFAKGKLYVLRSDGDIYKVKRLDEEEPKVKKYETNLKSENDTEGLCFDEKNEQLLVLCKERAGEHLNKHIRAIYAFGLENKKSSNTPIIKLNIKDILSQSGNKKFKPSAIAIHPITKTIYIVDSVGKVLVELSREGQVLSIQILAKRLFAQPEGMAFDEDGNLFISSEKGDAEQAQIVSFEYLGR